MRRRKRSYLKSTQQLLSELVARENRRVAWRRWRIANKLEQPELLEPWQEQLRKFRSEDQGA